MLTLKSSRNLIVNIPLLGDRTSNAYLGHDNGTLQPVEVLVLGKGSSVSQSELRSVQKWRSANQTRRVVVCLTEGEHVTIFGPVDDRQPLTLSANAAQRLLQRFLDDQNPVIATREIVSYYDSHGTTELGGVKNKGLFASHHIRENLPQRSDWTSLCLEGQKLSTKRHRELISELGFLIASEDSTAIILKGSTSENRAVALLLDENENFDSPGGRFPSSPVSWGLALAADKNIPWLIALRKDQIRLHPSVDGVGVGQKGQAETYFELNLAQVDDDQLGLLPLIFSADSFARDGVIQKLLEESSNYAVSLGARLRERVYEQVVPNIAIAVAKQLEKKGFPLDSAGLQTSYSITLRILFRILFQAYAEDRGLLPAGRNEGYDSNSLKSLAKRDMLAGGSDFGAVVGIWYDLLQVWDAIDEGNPRWQVPAYNGGLFGKDPSKHPEGALIKSLEISDAVLGPALQALLIDDSEDGVRGPVDFRSLSVREFGTIYEGLLESSLSLAEADLTVDVSGAWIPARRGDLVHVKAGEPYFHTASGERKATGSYFTPKFVVDHLVNQAITPALDQHLNRIRELIVKGDQVGAERSFFDFRVADLAMGSAHFLVAAVDRIEAQMRSFLSNQEHVIPGINDELARLRRAATEALAGDEIAILDIEDSSLLRRQIARRCIYGVDINSMAVELARLAIWIHTFVPGLPMSTLDHNLVLGNSLTGIGSLDEALDCLVPVRDRQPTIFDEAISSGLEKARELLLDAAQASEATKREVEAASELSKMAKQVSEESKMIFDAAIASRNGIVNPNSCFTAGDFVTAAKSESVRDLVRTLKPVHLPQQFPEVFLRPNPGFDVLLGNPPWEKIKVEEYRFWNLRFPGLIGLPQRDRNTRIEKLRAENPALVAEYTELLTGANQLRSALTLGLGANLGGGDVDLYQFFLVANWNAVRERTGRIGLVVPRNAFVGGGMAPWRKEVLENGSISSLIFATNNNSWIFEAVHPQYTVAVCVIAKARDANRFVGPVSSRTEFDRLVDSSFALATPEEILHMTEGAIIPSVHDATSYAIMKKMAESPAFEDRTDEWDFRPTRELDASLDRAILNVGQEASPGDTEIWAGASFQIWNPNHGPKFASQSTQKLRGYLAAKLNAQSKNKRSVYFEEIFAEDTLPMDRPRIAFRTISRALDTRTSIPILLPPSVAMTNGPVVYRRRGTEKDEALLLGIMSSLPFDWYSRRFVEMNFTFELLAKFPVPRNTGKARLRDRVVEIAGRLAAVDERYLSWAIKVGVEVNSIKSEEEKFSLTCELDALVARLFGLDQQQLDHIFKTFHRGWDFQPRLTEVSRYFDEIRGDE